MRKLNIILVCAICIGSEGRASNSSFLASEKQLEVDSLKSSYLEKEKENYLNFSSQGNTQKTLSKNVEDPSKEVSFLLKDNKNKIASHTNFQLLSRNTLKKPRGIKRSPHKGGYIKVFSPSLLNFIRNAQEIMGQNPPSRFSDLIKNSSLENNIEKARIYSQKMHQEIEACLSLITKEGVRSFPSEVFLSTRAPSPEEINLRKVRINLLQKQWEEAEDLYGGEERDPQAITVHILLHLEKAYIYPSQKKIFLNQAQEIYRNALLFFYNECQTSYTIKPSPELIGKIAMADSHYYTSACSSLHLYSLFEPLFPGISEEIISEYKTFKITYESFIEKLGDKFKNPFQGYPTHHDQN